MRVGNLFGQTLRDAPADAQIPSHKLLVRGAFIRQVAGGVYAWLPLGLRVLRKIEQIVREEMDRAGAVELLMSLLQPGDLWQKSGRWDQYGPVLYRIKDRSDRDFCLAPTHEEMITMLAETELPSYRDLPAIPYHIQWKFRDEPRPRGGLLRGREFLMKDAYSFDADQAGLEVSYEKMAAAYVAAFDRCSLEPVRVEADSSDIGGSVNNEFQIPSENGGDTFVGCSNGDYAANTEVASGRPPVPYEFGDAPAVPEKVHTPGKVTVADVAKQLGVEPRQLVKTLIYKMRGSGELVAAVIPGDRELNDLKLAKLLGGTADLLKEDEFAERGIAKGFSGPVGLEMRVLADRSLERAKNVATGANEADHHLTGVVAGRDFEPEAWVDLITATDGDICERCGRTLSIERGIEVGHIFQLVGAEYLAKLGATFTDETGAERPFVMGCYGLGVSRTMAAVVEVHHDDRGIIWPKAVAPYEVCVVLLSDDLKAVALADQLERELEERRIGCVVDDRSGTSPGVKFADADLIGYPLHVVIGKSYLQSGKLETKVRATGEKTDVEPTTEAVRARLADCP